MARGRGKPRSDGGKGARGELCTLTTEEVEQIHSLLVSEFAKTDNPVFPPGVRDRGLLESAVSRQHTQAGGRLKHPDVLSNAATLTYGICLNHAFHNGNKRTALVAMLVHLDRNRVVLDDTKHSEMFDMIVQTAKHTLGLPSKEHGRGHGSTTMRRDPDDEVAAVRDWLERRHRRRRRGERQVTFNQLRRLLERRGFALDAPHGNYINVYRMENVAPGLFRRAGERRYHLGKIGYPRDGALVSLDDIKKVRRLCGLTEEDGCDSDAFYDQEAVVDSFLNRYRVILRRLAAH